MPGDTTLAVSTSVSATEAALAHLATLHRRHPGMLLYQSGGCCDGSNPLALNPGDLSLTVTDQCVGTVGAVPFYIDTRQCGYLLGQTLCIDVRPGNLGSYSLEDGTGWYFVTLTTTCPLP
jgi:uncharacterized protein (DUF779 family)